jgi:hypothetical protein
MPSRQTSPIIPEVSTRLEAASDPSNWDGGEDEDEDEDEDDDDEEETDVVSSPAGFKYNISRLSPRTRQVVKGLFNQTSSKDPPLISLELCGLREGDSGGFYAFRESSFQILVSFPGC